MLSNMYISNKSINLNRIDIYGKTPFMNACINRQNYVVKLHCKLKTKICLRVKVK